MTDVAGYDIYFDAPFFFFTCELFEPADVAGDLAAAAAGFFFDAADDFVDFPEDPNTRSQPSENFVVDPVLTV